MAGQATCLRTTWPTPFSSLLQHNSLRSMWHESLIYAATMDKLNASFVGDHSLILTVPQILPRTYMNGSSIIRTIGALQPNTTFNHCEGFFWLGVHIWFAVLLQGKNTCMRHTCGTWLHGNFDHRIRCLLHSALRSKTRLNFSVPHQIASYRRIQKLAFVVPQGAHHSSSP